ncbi:Invasion associated locus B (IalB) protein [Pollutimonas bauzanensis]|uniref:Invasion associated locus B (IalB) protein n=1 Tax=Pollutimonas bauzanensis TaxID=658167 RepID=A0A1M5LYR7_9BURK|nr:Invasion associated locus B (IalB) protein [Pollutimonas bauzanensis]
MGCVVTIDVGAKLLTALRAGKTPQVHVTPDGGKVTAFSISLKSFGSAYDRTAALGKMTGANQSAPWGLLPQKVHRFMLY